MVQHFEPASDYDTFAIGNYMAANTKKNAIEKRINELTDIWNEFAQESEAIMLRWLLVPDEDRMIDLFLEMQNEELSDIPDLFIRFEEPFENPSQYGFVLQRALCSKYDEIREGIGEEGLLKDWKCPLPQPGDIPSFINCCHSFSEYYVDLMENLVVVLTPDKITDIRSWERWLIHLVSADLPPGLKVMVIDSLSSPILKDLADISADRVKSIAPNLNMPAALEELVQDIPGHTPGHVFRRLFVALSNAAGAGDLKKSQKAANSALAIATKEKWPQMQIVIHMALAGAFIGAGKFEAALAPYQQAEQIAVTAAEEGDPAAAKLIVKTKMAQASSLIAQSRYDEAAEIYESAAAVAENQQDHFMSLENWRMSAYCRETTEQFDHSWRSGLLAIQSAEKMDEDLRVNSTLPYVGQGLVRVAARREDSEGAKMIEQRMIELIGPEWQAGLETGDVSS
jgi:tetratricopeptide (TPR) repeat protein